MNEDLVNFCGRHRIGTITTDKICSKMMPLRYSTLGTADLQYHYETEPLCTIEIPLSELEKIIRFEKDVYEHLDKHGYSQWHRFNTEQVEREAYLQNKYPAVKKAYEQYQLVLKLVE